MTYPNGRLLTYSYGTAGGSDDAASRIAAYVDDDGTTHLADYTYLGQGSIVQVDSPEPGLRYTLIDPDGLNDPDTGDIYGGLDRFGRVKDLRWLPTGSSSSSGGGENDLVRIQHGYDRAGNRLYRKDPVAASYGKAFDELYTYDGLYRLQDMERGTLNAERTAITNGTATFAQCWTLDSTGNWQGFREDDDGAGSWDLVQARTANPVNEITGITNTVGSAWATPAYNAAGNMTTIPQPAAPGESYTATYDAWNRLTKLVDTTTSDTVQENAYDGRTFRTVRQDYAAGTLSETRQFYYTSGWQDIEERLGTTPDSADADRQFVWGLRYIDDLVLRDRDTDANGTLDERLYGMQDPNWNMVAIADAGGAVQERYAYSAYGVPVFMDGAFVTRLDSASAFTGLFCGYTYDLAVSLYAVRNRNYHAHLGTWITRDPVDTASQLYVYVGGRVTILVDPEGTIPQLVAGCAVGFVFGAGTQLFIDVVQEGFSRKACCNAACSGAGACITGGLIAQFPSPWIGCAAGALGNILSSLCQRSICQSRGPLNVCDIVTTVASGLVGCIAGAEARSLDEAGVTALAFSKFDVLLAAIGMNVSAWSAVCAAGGPAPDLSKACCTFDDGSEIWSETVDCPIGNTPRDCCTRRTKGFIFTFNSWKVLAANAGQC